MMKGRETFYGDHTVPSPAVVKFIMFYKRVILWKSLMIQYEMYDIVRQPYGICLGLVGLTAIRSQISYKFMKYHDFDMKSPVFWYIQAFSKHKTS